MPLTFIMPASLIVSSALFSSFSLARILTATVVTSDPTITPAPDIPIELFRKQNNDRFIGWLSLSGTWMSEACDPGGTLFQSGEYWRCCPTSLAGCNVPVGCARGSLIYSITTSGTASYTTIDCTSAYTAGASYTVCNSGFMYENSADPDARTNIFCGVSSLNWSYFRVRPTETSSVRSSTTSSPSSTTPQSTPADPTPTPSAEPQKSSSKAWIAGAVVGPIAGLALLGALLWFCIGRKRKNKSQPQPQPPMQHPQPGIPAPYPTPSHAGSSIVPITQHYDPQKQPNTVPYGVSSHNSWAASPPPHSPTSQGSTSPNPQQNPYGPPQGQQQWQPTPQNQQMYGPSQSPPPGQNLHAQNAQPYQQPGVTARPFSAEMDGATYQTAGTAAMPQQGQIQYPR